MTEDKKLDDGPALKLDRKPKQASMAMPGPRDIDHKKEMTTDSKEKKLKLDTQAHKPSKLRSELYDELLREEAEAERDFYSNSPISDRVFALAIDAAVLYGLYEWLLILEPKQFALISELLDRNDLQFWLGNEVMSNLIYFTTGFFMLFFFVVVPVSFFNWSIGKKVFGIIIRGKDQYSLSLAEAFLREIIMKPIGVVCLVGFIIPFFNKERQSLHDKVVGTFVVKATRLIRKT